MTLTEYGEEGGYDDGRILSSIIGSDRDTDCIESLSGERYDRNEINISI